MNDDDCTVDNGVNIQLFTDKWLVKCGILTFSFKILTFLSYNRYKILVVLLCSENIEMYCLHIAEDDGEVDTDFPSLDNREPVSKFGFSKLAIVEKDIPPPANNRSSHVVTV